MDRAGELMKGPIREAVGALVRLAWASCQIGIDCLSDWHEELTGCQIGMGWLSGWHELVIRLAWASCQIGMDWAEASQCFPKIM